MIRLLNPFNFFRKSSKNEKKAKIIYALIVKHSRNPVFFDQYGVADTIEGRLDLLMLHAFLMFQRYKTDDPLFRDLSQSVYDVMIKDIDLSMREQGIGDTGVSIRIKKITESLHGRINIYQQGLKDGLESPTLKDALRRNLFHKMNPTERNLGQICQYMHDCAYQLSNLNTDQLQQGAVEFADIPASLGIEKDKS